MEQIYQSSGQTSAAPAGLVALMQSDTGLLAQDVVIVKQRARQVVTAIQTLDNEVQLLSWRVNADGSLLRTGSSHVPLTEIQQVKLVRARNYVVACRTQRNELQLSRWDVSNTGAIYLAGTGATRIQDVQWVEMVALTPQLIALLVLTGTQTWRLMLWQLEGESALKLLDTQEVPDAAIGRGALAVLPASGGKARLATFVAESPALLTLQLWQVNNGETLALQATQRLVTPDAAAIALIHHDDRQLYAVVQTVTGQLRLLTWYVMTGEALIADAATTILAEGVSQYTSQSQPDGFSLIYRTVAGELCIQRWQQQPSGDLTLSHTGQSPVRLQGEVVCCDEALDGNAPLLTGAIDGQGAVTLTTWRSR